MSDQETYVYVIAKRDGDRFVAPVKVGITNSLGSRIAGIQTSCPFPVALIYSFACPNRDIAQAMERCFHETQAEHKAHGEWFDLHPLVALQLMCMGYRVMLEVNLSPELVEPSLERAGVLEAERRFKLHALPIKGKA